MQNETQTELSNLESYLNQVKTKPQGSVKRFHQVGHYKIQERIGKGSEGVVYQAVQLFTGLKVAVKVIDTRKLTNEQVDRIKYRISIHKILDHRHIVRFYEDIWTEGKVFIFMELVKGQQLLLHIQKYAPMKEETAAKIFSQITNAVNYIHQKNIAHRDLKIENIMLNKSLDAKIIDMGFAKNFTHPQFDRLSTFCGTPIYMAPELRNRKKYSGQLADVWSLGVILYAMLENSFPYKCPDPNIYSMDQQQENSQALKWRKSKHSSIQAVNLYKQIFKNENQRINIKNIIKSQFIIRNQKKQLVQNIQSPTKQDSKKKPGSKCSLKKQIIYNQTQNLHEKKDGKQKNKQEKINQKQILQKLKQIFKTNFQQIRKQIYYEQFGQIYSVYCLLKVYQRNLQQKWGQTFSQMEMAEKKDDQVKKFIQKENNKRREKRNSIKQHSQPSSVSKNDVKQCKQSIRNNNRSVNIDHNPLINSNQIIKVSLKQKNNYPKFNFSHAEKNAIIKMNKTEQLLAHQKQFFSQIPIANNIKMYKQSSKRKSAIERPRNSFLDNKINRNYKKVSKETNEKTKQKQVELSVPLVLNVIESQRQNSPIFSFYNQKTSNSIHEIQSNYPQASQNINKKQKIKLLSQKKKARSYNFTRLKTQNSLEQTLIHQKTDILKKQKQQRDSSNKKMNKNIDSSRNVIKIHYKSQQKNNSIDPKENIINRIYNDKTRKKFSERKIIKNFYNFVECQ